MQIATPASSPTTSQNNTTLRGMDELPIPTTCTAVACKTKTYEPDFRGFCEQCAEADPIGDFDCCTPRSARSNEEVRHG